MPVNLAGFRQAFCLLADLSTSQSFVPVAHTIQDFPFIRWYTRSLVSSKNRLQLDWIPTTSGARKTLNEAC